jgi:hypothetical protein
MVIDGVWLRRGCKRKQRYSYALSSGSDAEATAVQGSEKRLGVEGAVLCVESWVVRSGEEQEEARELAVFTGRGSRCRDSLALRARTNAAIVAWPARVPDSGMATVQAGTNTGSGECSSASPSARR